jgi:flagellum-specific ATP synthase
MTDTEFVNVASAIARATDTYPVGRVTGVSGSQAVLQGLSGRAALADRVRLPRCGHTGIVTRADGLETHIMLDGPANGVAVRDRAVLLPAPVFAPHDGWIGRVVDPDGQPLDGRPLTQGAQPVPLQAAPPPAGARRALGSRVGTGLALFDTILPLARGQRVGLFAGSGVGKSTLLANLARGVEADVIVIGLVGERGRELREFIEKVLGPDGMARCVIVAATSDRPAHTRRRCAAAATAVAEHFRDAGRHVLLLIDSVTRFAEAHREVSSAAGEPASLRGYPASTSAAIAALCERAGPGTEAAGDITAVYSVLVAGSDMEEPIADILRGVLDGHIVLDRAIAERGRFPAVDVVRSVSRSLPDVATAQENGLIAAARRHLGVYARSELMIQSGLYVPGSDKAVDEAIACHAALDAFCTEAAPHGPKAAFAALQRALSAATEGGRDTGPARDARGGG